jgi:hypothetical protein
MRRLCNQVGCRGPELRPLRIPRIRMTNLTGAHNPIQNPTLLYTEITALGDMPTHFASVSVCILCAFVHVEWWGKGQDGAPGPWRGPTIQLYLLWRWVCSVPVNEILRMGSSSLYKVVVTVTVGRWLIIGMCAGLHSE